MKKKEIDLSGVTPQTIGRTIILALALINQVLAIFGKEQIPFVESEVYQVVSILFTFTSTLWGYWKNNSWSKSAQEADKVMWALESGELEYTEKVNPHTTDHHYNGVG